MTGWRKLWFTVNLQSPSENLLSHRTLHAFALGLLPQKALPMLHYATEFAAGLFAHRDGLDHDLDL